ncbi:chromate resistance protein ChrB domain-containing protein [Chitinophaga tropicalis]|uniref:Helix-turn-helix domain-containing protein n=1 Tax=Chitinophaga tropicalis TaxID=2683588 RepID=A0A7K1U2Q5_9BACT|nr:chromate resistance protein ChrB domain-containing protein [Chitinophaga tropicalis]MVT08566.1 helix-turn-helix domain-containing protein [Chitinophaga tropicalis]
MKWITRERPKIDRIACPWLIRRFIDPDAEIIFAPAAEVLPQAKTLDAIPFDMPGVEYSHYDDRCTFDYFLKKHQLKDAALERIAVIVRGADTDRHDFSAQSAGLEAIFSGLAYNIKNDHELLELGMTIYDGLYSWARHLYHLKHTQAGPVEQMLLEVFHKYIQKKDSQQVPDWANELKEIIQDQMDTNFTLSLKDISKDLDINPTYLSREFSKYFDNLSYGEYIRKMRIEKAIDLLKNTGYSLTEIAYLTGFSDQSHFTRVFRQQMGTTPSSYKKQLLKGKENTKR